MINCGIGKQEHMACFPWLSSLHEANKKNADAKKDFEKSNVKFQKLVKKQEQLFRGMCFFVQMEST